MRASLNRSVQVRARPAEAELIRPAVRKEEAAVRAIIQGHNRRLYRVARSIVRDDGEAGTCYRRPSCGQHVIGMANEFRTSTAHSAEYFGDTRDYWWNSDYLGLVSKRLSLNRVEKVLDVGCGVGHVVSAFAPASYTSDQTSTALNTSNYPFKALSLVLHLGVAASPSMPPTGWT